MRRYKQIVTVCGVLVALSMFAVGGVSAQNASDYPPVDVESTVEIYDGNDSLNDSIELDHARGYDDEALAVWDCSVGDCSATDSNGNLSAFAGSGTLSVVSKNNMTVSRNADNWKFTTNGTNPEIVVEASIDNPPTNNSSTYIFGGDGIKFKALPYGTSYTPMGNEQTTVVADGDGNIIQYKNGSEAATTSYSSNQNNLSALRLQWTSNGLLSMVGILDTPVSSGEASLLADGYRVGAFVPDSTTTTGQNLPDNASLTWDVNRLRDAETTLKVQSYDGADWITEETLTVDQTAEYDIGVDGGEEYRFVSEPNSTVDSGGGGYFFGGGSSMLNIFGVVVTRSMATGLGGLAVLVTVLAFFYPGMRLFGKGSDQ